MDSKLTEKQRAKLDRFLNALKKAGVEHGSRNRIVAEKTGYSEKSVGNLLSGNTKLSDRFIRAVCSAFSIDYHEATGLFDIDIMDKMPRGTIFASASREEITRRIKEINLSSPIPYRAPLPKNAAELREYADLMEELNGIIEAGTLTVSELKSIVDFTKAIFEKDSINGGSE